MNYHQKRFIRANFTLVLALAVFGLADAIPELRGQSFEEPTNLNQPVMQMADDPFFGEYEGTYTAGDMKVEDGGLRPVTAEAQVVAQGHGHYKIVLRAKAVVLDLRSRSTFSERVKKIERPLGTSVGLWQIELNGEVKGDKLAVSGYAGGHDWNGEIAKDSLHINKGSYGGGFQMTHVIRTSPNEGLKPPHGAIVLLADTPGEKPSLEQWQDSGWVATAMGIMHKNLGAAGQPAPAAKDLRTKREFRNVHLHVEFRIPYQPEQREQERGNSGVILADRYEVQVLDSYGLIEGTGDCAAIYGVAPPAVNAAFPPLSWQTYDIDFRAPKMDADGKMTRPATLTVVWNGIKVHENQTTPTPTGDPKRPNAAMGPLRIQDHGPTVFFKNIWLQELPD